MTFKSFYIQSKKNKLNEVFTTSSSELKITNTWQKYQGGRLQVADFGAPNGDDYKLIFHNIKGTVPNTLRAIAKKVIKPLAKYKEVIEGNNTWEVAFKNMSAVQRGESGYGVTQSGDSVKIFGMVFNAIIDKVNSDSNIKTIMFSAEEDSRKALYSRGLPLLAKKLNSQYLTTENIPDKKQYYFIFT